LADDLSWCSNNPIEAALAFTIDDDVLPELIMIDSVDIEQVFNLKRLIANIQGIDRKVSLKSVIFAQVRINYD
jgi:hypothetical protein